MDQQEADLGENIKETSPAKDTGASKETPGEQSAVNLGDNAAKESQESEKADISSPQQADSASKQQLIEDILAHKDKIASLMTNLRTTKALCEKYDHNNQYLQDYVGTLMKNRK